MNPSALLCFHVPAVRHALFLRQRTQWAKIIVLAPKGFQPEGLLRAAGLDPAAWKSKVQVIEVACTATQAEVQTALRQYLVPEEGGLEVLLSGTSSEWDVAVTTEVVSYLKGAHTWRYSHGFFNRMWPETGSEPVQAHLDLAHLMSLFSLNPGPAPKWQEKLLLADKVFAHISGRIPDKHIQERLHEARIDPIETLFPHLNQVDRKFYQQEWLRVWLAGEIQAVLNLSPGNLYPGLVLNHPLFAGPATPDLIFVWNNRMYLGICRFFQKGKTSEPDQLTPELIRLQHLALRWQVDFFPFVVVLGANGSLPAINDLLATFGVSPVATLDTLRDPAQLEEYLQLLSPLR